MFSNHVLSLNKSSDLKGDYIAYTYFSIICPYYLSSYDDVKYSILIFSKEYFEVKRKFKELRKDKNKRVKFE